MGQLVEPAQAWQRIRAVVDGYGSSIVPLIGERYGPRAIQQAWRDFTLGSDTTFSLDDPHTELFFSWLLHRWAPTAKKGDTTTDERLYGVAPTRAYLDANAAALDPTLRDYLEACLASPFGFYQVLECRPGVGFDARDLLASRELELNEALASVSLRSGDIIFAHLATVHGFVLVDAISPFSFPAPFGTRVRRSRGRYARAPTDRSLRRLYFALLESYLRTAH
jgi:hypothetical protein